MKEGDQFSIKCDFCQETAIGILAYFYGYGTAHIDAECKECGAIWSYNDPDTPEE